jgi:DNA-binding NarL/FixJ family response regulator
MIGSIVDPIRVAISSNQHLTWVGLQIILESRKTIRVVGKPCQRITSHLLPTENRPDVIILDTETERDLVSSVRVIRKAAPKTKVVLLSGLEDNGRVREAFEYGVEGVILKVHPPAVVVTLIEALYSSTNNNHAHFKNDTPACTDLEKTMLAKAEPEAQTSTWPDALTDREREVIRLVGEGLSNKDIAYHLSISDSTVRHHLTSIFDKVGVPNRQKLLIHTHHLRATPI